MKTKQDSFQVETFVGENTRQIYDILQFTEEDNLPILILLIDFEKAFDSVSWHFITKVFNYFKFGQSFMSWISPFYKNAKLCINQGGILSTFFHIGMGC